MSEDFQHLLRKAFLAAKQRGKTDWNIMTLAVLRNRLLQMTSYEFSEESYGADNLKSLLSNHSDFVSIEYDQNKGAIAIWKGAEEGECLNSVARRQNDESLQQKIRHDLWVAILDYSSGKNYEWDISSKSVKTGGGKDSEMRLPTINFHILVKWASEFKTTYKSTPQEHDLEVWTARGLGDFGLPPDIRQKWRTFKKDKVANCILEWFKEKSIAFNESDIYAIEARDVGDLSDNKKASVELRELVLKCVGEMSSNELESLLIPARAFHSALDRILP